MISFTRVRGIVFVLHRYCTRIRLYYMYQNVSLIIARTTFVHDFSGLLHKPSVMTDDKLLYFEFIKIWNRKKCTMRT